MLDIYINQLLVRMYFISSINDNAAYTRNKMKHLKMKLLQICIFKRKKNILKNTTIITLKCILSVYEQQKKTIKQKKRKIK